jgi:hypothetical protein
MERLIRIPCRMGIHTWSPWRLTETVLEPETGHAVLDSIVDTLIVETKDRSCDKCGKLDIKQTLKW